MFGILPAAPYNDKKTLDSVKRINKKESAPLTSKKSRLNKNEVLDSLNKREL